MTSNADKVISIYNLPSLESQAFNKAFTRDNSLSGFKKYGISASATDCPSPHASLN